MESVLIKNARFIISPERVFSGDIFIENGKIAGFERGEADVVIDASNMAVLPGLINAHTHLAMNFLRGIAEDKPLQQWLEQDIWPRERKINEKLVYYAAVIGVAEALESGTTSFVDMYFYEEEIAKAAHELGARAWVGYGLIDLFDPEKREEELKRAKELVKKVRSLRSELVTPVISPHAPYTCSPELIIKAHELAERYDLIYHIHVSETKREVEEILKKHGSTPLLYLEKLGVVDSRFLGAHGVWITPREMVVLAKRRGSIVHNPTSNLKLGSGIAPVKKFIEKGVNVALGTDGQASNNDLDMWEEMRLMALLQKLSDVTFPSIEALKSATVNGAKALGFDGGVIKEGAPADLVLLDLEKIHFFPAFTKAQVVNNIIFAASKGDVNYVIVNGDIVVKNGRHVMQDKVQKAKEEVRKLAEKLGVI